MNPTQKSYWFITSEWLEMPKAIIDSPNGQPHIPQRMTANALIDVHPVLYAVSMQSKFAGYVITYAMQINKEMFELVMNAEVRPQGNGHKEAAELVQ